jgi:hypothetical protein
MNVMAHNPVPVEVLRGLKAQTDETARQLLLKEIINTIYNRVISVASYSSEGSYIYNYYTEKYLMSILYVI